METLDCLQITHSQPATQIGTSAHCPAYLTSILWHTPSLQAACSAVQRSVTQSTSRAVTVSSCLLLYLHSVSIHSQHQCTNRLQLQVDRGGARPPRSRPTVLDLGGYGRGPRCRYTPRLCREREAVAPCCSCRQLPYVGLQCCTSNGLAVRCSRFPGNLVS